MMQTLLRLSHRAYATLLPLYPPELRCDFAEDMRDAFAEDLEHASRTRGLRGILRVWLCSVRELLYIALPGQFRKSIVAVPSVVFALCEITMAAELMLCHLNPTESARGLPPLELIPVAALIPSFASAFVAVVVVLAGNRSLPTRLKLSSR